LSIDLGAVVANWRLLAERAAPAECAAVVKADAYGLGVAEVARALAAAGCGTFFVATVDEAVALRGLLGDDPSIVVLHGTTDVGEARELQRLNLLPVLNSLGQVAVWNGLSKIGGTPLPCVVHIDTGMNRLGLSAEEVQSIARDRSLVSGCDVRLVMSHLACAEESDNKMNRRQLVTFLQRCAALPTAPQSLANSAGIFLGDGYRFEMVRPGIALYGANPTPLAVPSGVNPMAEVVHLQGRILQSRRVDVNETVGYGAAFSVTAPTRIATVAAGYADGYLRSLSGRGAAIVAGKRVPLVGRVSMDLITLDVSAVPEADAQPGAPVSLIGGGVSLDEVATHAGTIPYEILTSLGSRYRREYRAAPATS
jgi:alanine racemase